MVPCKDRRSTEKKKPRKVQSIYGILVYNGESIANKKREWGYSVNGVGTTSIS